MKGLGPYQKPTFLSLILVSFFSTIWCQMLFELFSDFFIAIYVPRGPLTPSTLGCQQLKYLSQRTKLVHPPTPMSQLLLHAPHNTPPTIIHLFLTRTPLIVPRISHFNQTMPTLVLGLEISSAMCCNNPLVVDLW